MVQKLRAIIVCSREQAVIGGEGGGVECWHVIVVKWQGEWGREGGRVEVEVAETLLFTLSWDESCLEKMKSNSRPFAGLLTRWFGKNTRRYYELQLDNKSIKC